MVSSYLYRFIFGLLSNPTEQKIDGKALKLLSKEGSRTQYEACGLATVGDQLLLKELVCPLDEVPVAAYRRSKKPTLDQRIYKAK